MVNGPPSHQLYDLRVAFYDPSAPHSIKFADHRPENGRRENPDESTNISTGNHPQCRRLLSIRNALSTIHSPVFTVLCFLELTNPSSRSLTRTMLCFHALTNPSASNSFVFTSIQNAGVSPSNPRPALGAFAIDRAKSFRCHTSAKCARNSFPCHTSENTGGGAYYG